MPGYGSQARYDDDPHILPEECEVLGEWTLEGIRPGPRAAVSVTFHVDANGILHLTAQEEGTRNILRQEIARW
jgi:molecular chaperone DnaK (HSP70)